MFALGPIAQAEQQASLTDTQRHHQAERLSEAPGRLSADNRTCTNSQHSRPCSGDSRPTSAIGASRQRPSSAALTTARPWSPWTADASGSLEQQRSGEGGLDQVDDASAGPRVSSANRSRPRSAVSSKQQQHKQQQQHQYSQQQLGKSQQKQRSQSPSILRALRPASQPSAERNYKIKAALFPQQQLLQPPPRRIPDVISTLLTAADCKQAAPTAAAAAADGALLDINPDATVDVDVVTRSSSPEGVTAAHSYAAAEDIKKVKRHASIINIGCPDVDCSSTDSLNKNSYSSDGNGTAGRIYSNDDVVLIDTARPGLLTVLGTIQEEDSMLIQQQQQQQQEALIAVQQHQRCLSPVNLPDDVSFDSNSFTNSGRTSPVAAAALGHCCQQQQQRSRSACSSRDQHCCQQQQQQGGGVTVDTTDLSAALVCDVYNVPARPVSAAAMQAAKRFYGGRMQQQQQQQQPRRCESAQARYSIDTRLMSRSGGRFSPCVSVQASRGGGFCIRRQQQQQSRPPSTGSRSHSGTRSPAAAASVATAAVAEVVGLNSLLSTSRCGSRQQRQRRQQQQQQKHTEPVIPGIVTAADCNTDVCDIYEVQAVQPAASEGADAKEATQPQTETVHYAAAAYEVDKSLASVDAGQQLSSSSSSNNNSGDNNAESHMHVCQAASPPPPPAAAVTVVQVPSLPATAVQVQYRLESSVPLRAAAVAAAHLQERQQQCLSAKKAAARLNASRRQHPIRSAGSRCSSTSAAAAGGGGSKQQSKSSVFSSKRVYTSSSSSVNRGII